ncbi:T9SS type A sorting domain-containing protein [Polaribacter sp. HaHaR_3_91]|uniref:T9SS type A sorting domain-containing protein n=1 Tax=Polaribacter sp. HaHaR_3_91 TaxID=2745561 RepID=UPI001C4FBE28|nr:T9SS type A sorting domain-containing protein [Polaribacter sp. HaHaR_3_91]QXP62528.1 T9SS type A sorting domain-containing protein [Polaribacter sp. HaHaR_3_91]
MKFTSPLFFLFVLLQITINAQSLSYSGSGSYNITSPTHVGAYVVPTQEIKPTGMIFGDSGTKFYMIGSDGDYVIQYSLNTAYDISSRGPIVGYFDVFVEESNPQDVIFNATGTKMYILGGAGDDVIEYVVPTPWNVSSIDTGINIPVYFNAEAAIDAYLVPDNHGDELSGFRFNADGSKLFIVDYSSDKVFEFGLGTDYDISTATITDDLDISGEETQARAIEFNNNGKELYVIGYSGDDINSYNLVTGYDLSTFSTKTNSIKLLAEDKPEAFLINNDGTKVYVAGFVDQDIKEYALSPTYDFSTISVTPSASTIFVTLELNPLGMVFNTDGTKLFVVGSTSDRVLEMSLSTPYDISSGTLVNILLIESEEKVPEGLAFDNTGTILFVIGSEDSEINQYALSSPFDLSSATYSSTFSLNIIATDNEDSPRDLFFKADGFKLFILAGSTDRIYQFTLANDYDLTTLASDINGFYSVNSVDTRTEGFTFNSDGSKFFVAGDTGDNIYEFTLTNNFDVTSGTITNTNTFSIAAEEGTITDIVFNGDGSRFYITGTGDDEINQYYTKGFLPETPNDGTIDDTTTPFIITLTGDTFFASSGVFTALEVTIGNVPPGLTAVLTHNSSTEAQLSFTGKAISHINSDEAAANLIFTFTDAAFTSSNAADVSFAVAQTNVLGFDFIECADNEIVYNGTWTGGNNSGTPDDSGTDLTKGIRTQGDVTITVNTNCDCLHVESGQTLTVADGVELTVANALELNGDIRLLGSAQLKQTHTGVKNASGSGNLYKDVKGNLSNIYQTSYWSSPVTTDGETYNIKGVLKDGTTPLAATGTPLHITFTDNYNGDNNTSPITLSRRWLAKFVNNNDWTRQIDESTTLLNPVEGFTKKSTGNATGQNYTFVGRPNDGDYNSEIAAYGSGTWSVLGNPYPTPINADTFITDNSGVIVGTLYFYESGDDTSHVRGEYLGGYATRTSGIGAPASGIGGIGTKTPNQNIDIGQGFFVEASASGGTVSFNNAQRVFDVSGAATEVFHKNKDVAKKTSFPILRIGFEFLLTDQTYHRQVSIGFRGLTAEYEDGFEAEMWDYKSTDMALEIEGKDLPYAITGIEDFNQSLVIPLKVQTNLNRDVTFKIDNMTDIDSDVYLYDSVTQDYFDITSKNAIVNLDAGVYDNRFFITFNKTTLGLEINATNKFTVKKQDKDLIISSKEILDEVQIYNLLGQNVVSKKNTLKQSEIKMNTTNFKKGIYIIRVRNSNGSFSKKISVY